jgi:geranylgeranyl pyrophosphate synthase
MSGDGDFSLEFPDLFHERGQKVLERFKEAIFTDIEDSKLISILEHVKKNWKDTYRPALTSFSCEAVGGDPDSTITPSLMITLTGAGIGIHDDIIDKSSIKHFRRTFFGLRNRDEALVVGDLLIIKALTLTQKIFDEISNPKKASDVIKTLENYFFKMCVGELMEISCRKNIEIDLEYYDEALWKLGSDIEACTKVGAILGDGSKREVEALTEYGRRLGYIVRLTEDVKDTLNLEGNLSHRLQYESIPLPILYAAKDSRENLSEIKNILEGSSINASDIKKLLELCFETEAFTYTEDIAKKNVTEGIKELNILKPSKSRDILSLLIKRTFPKIQG